jgi:sugar lactone lactonase YvrE
MIQYRAIVPFAAFLLACSSENETDGSATTESALNASPGVNILASFAPTAGQLPEGLALRQGSTYVTFAPLAQIARIAPNGAVSTYATLPPANGRGYTLGLLFDGAALLAAQASFDPSTFAPGIYRVPAGGGNPSAPWATHPKMTFPNGLAHDPNGGLWVADSTGGIFRIDATGRVTEWSNDPLLVGDTVTCNFPLPLGANGIVVTSDTVWVTNTARGTLVRIPILAGGGAGQATAMVDDCKFSGADGLAQAADGSFLIAVNWKNEIVRVVPGQAPTVLRAGAPLDFPASLVVEDERVLVTSAAFLSGASGHPSVAAVSQD